MLITDRFFEALVLRNVFTDFIVAIHTKKLMANQNAASSRSDSSENQYIVGGIEEGIQWKRYHIICVYPCQLSGKP
jgi:hypothetical protein